MKDKPKKNLCSKMRKIKNPYEIWATPDLSWKWFVLKKWQRPDKEVGNAFARWFCAVTSPYVSTPEYGDVYVREIVMEAFQVIGVCDISEYHEYYCFEHFSEAKSPGLILDNKVKYPQLTKATCHKCDRELMLIEPTAKFVDSLFNLEYLMSRYLNQYQVCKE